MSHNTQKKAAIINDMSGFGRCAITVALPIISTLKVQCCPVPTSIFSNHTAFPNYFFDDYTGKMQAYIDEWKKLGLTFDGIETGFLGSKEQIEIVIGFLNDFRIDSTVVVVDPIMGDHGKTYATYTRAMCEEMKRLICYADIITPNMTEACILADRTYQEEKWKIRQIRELAERLSEMGPKKVVITGIPQGEYIANYCYEKDGEAKLLRTLKVGTQRCGTGDIFASIITADAVNGVPFQASVRKASNFIKRCIQKSIELEIPVTDGVCFEEILRTLR
ncbi:MAG: pyridoxamine kinase [Hungatella sp.]